MGINIALIGNPNTGKTTLFNALTGANQYVGNWPGVTVEKKSGKLKNHKDVNIVDLPGIYSLSPYTLEEVISRNYLIDEKPNLILNILDGTNLERNLYLTSQLVELNIPCILLVNMLDILNKNDEKINLKTLEDTFSCPVIEISALKKEGFDTVINKALELVASKDKVSFFKFDEKVELALDKITALLPTDTNEDLKRFYSIKLFEKDEEAQKKIKLDDNSKKEITQIIELTEKELDDTSDAIISSNRYNNISLLLKDLYIRKNKAKMSLSDKIDMVVTNRILALPIFAAIMFFIYYISVTTIGTLVTDYTNEVLFGEIVPEFLNANLENLGVSAWLSSLLVDGIFAGVGAVLGFLPQMFILFFFLAFLEECGYMARIAFIMDKVFRKFGLSGKSFIPILIGTGCSVPGIMAARTIENEKDRKMTIITTSFMPCGAKLPVIALISAAIFDEAWWLGPSAYFLGIFTIIMSGIILKKTFMFKGDTSPFIIELPAYHLPSFNSVLRSMWERCWSFIKKAGSVILLASVIIWFLSRFGMVDNSFTLLDEEQLELSLLANIGNSFAFIFAPLGFNDWRAAIASITGLVAKENVVSTFGVLYGFAELSEEATEIWANLSASFTQVSGYSFLIFNLLCAPCFAAIGAIKREMNSFKWTVFALLYQTGLAYVMALIAYQFGAFIFYREINIISLSFATVFLLILIYLTFRPNKYKNRG